MSSKEDVFDMNQETPKPAPPPPEAEASPSSPKEGGDSALRERASSVATNATSSQKEAAAEPTPAASPKKDVTPEKSEVAFKDNGEAFNEEWDDIVPTETDTKGRKQKAKKKDDPFQDVLSGWPRSRVDALTDNVPHAPWHEHKYKFKTYPQIMNGEEVCNWLVKQNFAADLGEATAIGSALVNRHLIYHMKKKREAEGFQPNPKFMFSLTPIDFEAQTKFFLTRLVEEKEEAKDPGVKFSEEGNLVAARIEERHRREAGDGPSCLFSSDGLKKTDPPSMSCEMAEVPIPAVMDATPDLCEWMDDWKVEVVEEKTDNAGWVYAKDDWNEKEFVPKEDREKHNIRKRCWIRHARKRPERKKQEMRNLELEEAAQVGEDDDTLLSKAREAAQRIPRQGFMEVHVHRGEHLWRKCDSFIQVMYRGEGEKSGICKKASEHAWNHKAFLNIKSDLDAVNIIVWQNNSGKKKVCLGQAEFFVPEGETSGERNLKMKPADDDRTAQLAGFGANDLGNIVVDWSFSVDGDATSGAAGAANNQLQRCVLSLHVKKAYQLSIDKTRLGPCGVLAVSTFKKPKIFLKAVYKGELCEMISESEHKPFKSDVEFDWKVMLDCVPSAPVQVEIWAENYPNPFARFTMQYEGEHSDQSTTLGLRGMTDTLHSATNDTSDDAIMSAGGKYGKVDVDFKWEPMKSTMEEIIEAQEETLAAEGQSRNSSNMINFW